MRILIAGLLSILISGIASAKINISVTEPDNTEQKTWTSSDKKISFDYPSDWGPEKPKKDGGVQLHKAGKGWFELSIIKLPRGENIEGFSRHIIEKSKGDDWDIRLKKDLGSESIGDKTAWVHQYRHKKKARTYYGYHFVCKGDVGIRVLMVKISREGGDTMMDMLRSLHYPQAAGSVASIPVASGDFAGETASLNKTETTKTAFGTYHKKGNVKGRIRLKNRKDKSAYPCYIKFQPVKQVKGRGRSRSRKDYEPAGPPVLTATNKRGYYHVDLEEGTYFVDIYNSDGENWPLLKGDILHRSKAKRFHNCQIDNRK